MNKYNNNDTTTHPAYRQEVVVFGEKPEEIAVAKLYASESRGGVAYYEWQLEYVGSYASDGDIYWDVTHWLPLDEFNKRIGR